MIPRERHDNPFEDQSTAKKGMGDRDSGGDNNSDDKVRGADDNEHGTSEKLKRKDYEKELERLHGELVKLQEWVRHEGKKICIVFEGRDGAGKGGVIKDHHRQGQSTDLPGSRPSRADRAGEIANVYPALSPRICQQAVRS